MCKKNIQYTKTHLHSIQLCKIMNNTLYKTDQYFVLYRTILCAIKAAIILRKTLCNFVQYMNKTFVQPFLILLLCKTLCNVWKKCNTCNVGNKKNYSTVLHILLNIGSSERLGLQMKDPGEPAAWQKTMPDRKRWKISITSATLWRTASAGSYLGPGPACPARSRTSGPNWVCLSLSAVTCLS